MWLLQIDSSIETLHIALCLSIQLLQIASCINTYYFVPVYFTATDWLLYKYTTHYLVPVYPTATVWLLSKYTLLSACIYMTGTHWLLYKYTTHYLAPVYPTAAGRLWSGPGACAMSDEQLQGGHPVPVREGEAVPADPSLSHAAQRTLAHHWDMQEVRVRHSRTLLTFIGRYSNASLTNPLHRLTHSPILIALHGFQAIAHTIPLWRYSNSLNQPGVGR